MSNVIVGDRVGAISHADKDTVYLFGYGVYEGFFEPPVGPFGASKEEWGEMLRMRGQEPAPFPLNPRIRLDNGKVVWGLECHWGSEERIKEIIGDRKVVMIEPNFDALDENESTQPQHEEAIANEEGSASEAKAAD